MAGRRVVVRRPRARKNGQEVDLPSWQQFANEEPLNERTMEQTVIGVSTREYERSLEELPDELGAHGDSKSAASRRFVAMIQEAAEKWMQRDLSQLNLIALMIDGIGMGDQTVPVVLGIDEAGLGLWLGPTENSTVCRDLLNNLIERGLDSQQRHLFVIDGSKALRIAIRDIFGDRALVQSCQEHKLRSVDSYLPKGYSRAQRRRCATPTGAAPSRRRGNSLLALVEGGT